MVNEFIVPLTILITSLIVIGIAAKYAVEKTLRLARFFGMGEMAAGFIFLALMTSFPEFSIAVISFSGGQNNLSFGDILGSNIVNFTFTLGVCAFIGLKKLNKEEISYALRTILLFIAAFIFLIDGHLGYADGLLLLLLFVVFIKYSSTCCITLNAKEKIPIKVAFRDFVIFLVASATIIVGAGFAVSSASELALRAGIAQTFIGATLIALSTSVPELAVDLAALRRRKGSLIIGETIGSCICNMTLVLGVGTLISPFSPDVEFIGPLIGLAILPSLLIALFLWKEKTIKKRRAIILFGIYAIYLILLSGIQILKF